MDDTTANVHRKVFLTPLSGNAVMNPWKSTRWLIGGLAGSVLAGWVADVHDSYQLPFQVFGIGIITAIPLMLRAKPGGGYSPETITSA